MVVELYDGGIDSGVKSRKIKRLDPALGFENES
jgi:hypothetical protein